jgi:Antitoxin VbhA
MDDKLKRAADVRDVIASARIEGQEITPKTLALLDRFVAGEITIEQVIEDTKKRYGLSLN